MSVGFKSDLGSSLWNDEIQSRLCGIDVGLSSGIQRTVDRNKEASGIFQGPHDEEKGGKKEKREKH